MATLNWHKVSQDYWMCLRYDVWCEKDGWHVSNLYGKSLPGNRTYRTAAAAKRAAQSYYDQG